MNYPKCRICQQRPATKTNSHIVPSFLVAKVCSYDGSGERDKEVMFTISPYGEKVYTGKIPSTKYDELFDMEALSDERIEKELKDNTVSEDYIFCPSCEKKLSEILETPYASYENKETYISSDTKYMFWVSVVWRMSISEQYGFRFPSIYEDQLQCALHNYMEAKENGNNAIGIINNCPIVFRIIKCTDINVALYIDGDYDKKRNILSYLFGNIFLVASFKDELPGDYHYLGIEDNIRKAPICKGNQDDDIMLIEETIFNKLNCNYAKQKAQIKRDFECQKADVLWSAIGLSGQMPHHMKKALIDRIYSEEAKLGDLLTLERYEVVFKEILQSFGYKPK